jgi:hypothetical protein
MTYDRGRAIGAWVLIGVAIAEVAIVVLALSG